jgi:hypothetical protein
MNALETAIIAAFVIQLVVWAALVIWLLIENKNRKK